jgi:hypothetical protein
LQRQRPQHNQRPLSQTRRRRRRGFPATLAISVAGRRTAASCRDALRHMSLARSAGAGGTRRLDRCAPHRPAELQLGCCQGALVMLSGAGTDCAKSSENATSDSQAQHNTRLNIHAGLGARLCRPTLAPTHGSSWRVGHPARFRAAQHSFRPRSGLALPVEGRSTVRNWKRKSAAGFPDVRFGDGGPLGVDAQPLKPTGATGGGGHQLLAGSPVGGDTASALSACCPAPSQRATGWWGGCYAGCRTR